MNSVKTIFFAMLISVVLLAASSMAISSLLDYTPRVEAAPTYMGEYQGYKVTCSDTPKAASHPTTKLISTCAKASFSSVKIDPKNKDRCLKIAYSGSSVLYTWGMTFKVQKTERSSFRCLRPA